MTHRTSLELPPGHHDSVTLHDVVAWRFSDESAPVRAAPEELRRAAAVVCVSEFTANEAEMLLGLRNTHVVHNGVDPRFIDASPLPTKTLRGLGITGDYVLHAGGATLRKNLDELAASWSIIHREQPDLQLVLAGPEHARRRDLFGALPGVVLIGRVADDLVPGLVAASRAVVVPSLYEGFGLPVLEAMAANVPVVAAATSSLPEVAGDAGILVAPNAQGIATGVIDALSGASEVSQRVRSGRARAELFTWERAADGHARVWASIA